MESAVSKGGDHRVHTFIRSLDQVHCLHYLHHVGLVGSWLSREGIASQLGIEVARVYRVSKAALWRPINDDNGGRPLLSQS